MSLRKLAQILEHAPGEELLSATSLNRIEKGEQSLTPPILAALALAFGCGPEDILLVDPIKHPELVDFQAACRRVRNMRPDQIAHATRVLSAYA